AGALGAQPDAQPVGVHVKRSEGSVRHRLPGFHNEGLGCWSRSPRTGHVGAGGRMAARVVLREITGEEGNRLLRIVRRTSGSVVTWRRAQMVLLSAQGMDVGQIAKVAFTSPDRVRAVLHNFNDDGFDSLVPQYS